MSLYSIFLHRVTEANSKSDTPVTTAIRLSEQTFITYFSFSLRALLFMLLLSVNFLAIIATIFDEVAVIAKL